MGKHTIVIRTEIEIDLDYPNGVDPLVAATKYLGAYFEALGLRDVNDGPKPYIYLSDATLVDVLTERTITIPKEE